MLNRTAKRQTPLSPQKIQDRAQPHLPTPAGFATTRTPLGTHRPTGLLSSVRLLHPPFIFIDLKWQLRCLLFFSCLLFWRPINVGIITMLIITRIFCKRSLELLNRLFFRDAWSYWAVQHGACLLLELPGFIFYMKEQVFIGERVTMVFLRERFVPPLCSEGSGPVLSPGTI